MNDLSELSPTEKFEWGTKAIGKGNLSDGLDMIRAAAFEGHPEAVVVSSIVWKRRNEKKTEAYLAMQQFLLDWMQSDQSPLNPNSPCRLQAEEGAA